MRSVLFGADAPLAGRRSQLTWKQFLAAHAETVVAADFFKRLYVLMHLVTRRILVPSCTSEPNAAWVTQQGRNLSWRLEDEDIQLSAVIHDRDKKFARAADIIFRSAGARVILTQPLAPKANAHAERWIGSCRRECRDWMLVVNQRPLEAIVRDYCGHYNDERPHLSLSLRPPTSRGDPIPSTDGPITRHSRLGGILNTYRRLALAA